MKVVVSGAASGIGAATSERLERAGHEVLRADVNSSAEIRHLDVTDEESWISVLEEAWPYDALVNCAGIRSRSPIGELSTASFLQLMDVHVTGTFIGIRESSKQWMAASSQGAIVNIASVTATHAVSGQAHYVTAKAALAGLTRAAAAELSEHAIRVNAIAPGIIRTPMTADRLSEPEEVGRLLKRVPARRVGDPTEVAAAVSWLLSDEASYVAGAVLPVDGGWTAT